MGLQTRVTRLEQAHGGELPDDEAARMARFNSLLDTLNDEQLRRLEACFDDTGRALVSEEEWGQLLDEIDAEVKSGKQRS